MKRNFVLIWLLLALALSAFAQTPIRKPTSAGGGAGVTDGDKGDVTISGTGATYTVDANAITFAKMVQISSGGLLGRATAGTGNIEALTAAQARALLGLAATDAAQFGTVSVVKEWGGANAANLIFSGRAYGDAARIDFIHSGGTVAAPSRTLNGAYMLRVGVRGTDNAGTPTVSNSPRASLIAAATESFTASAQGTQWIITTTPNGSLTEQPRVTIDQDGRFKLHGLSGTGSRFIIADSNNYFDVQTASQARTLLGLGPADSATFGAITTNPAYNTKGFTLTMVANNSSNGSDFLIGQEFNFNDTSTGNRLTAQPFRFNYNRNAGATGNPTAYDSMAVFAPTINANMTGPLYGIEIGGNYGSATLGNYTRLRLTAAGTITTNYAIISDPTAGDFGFGVTSPSAKLHVTSDSTTKVAGIFQAASGVADTQSTVSIRNGAGTEKFGVTAGGIVTLGSVTNSSPSNGQVWYDGTNISFREGGTTKTIGGISARTYSGAYSIFPKNSTGDSSGSYTANTVYFYKTSEPDAITINRIGTYVFTGSAGATLDIGFYSSDCATKLISTGATDVTSSSTSLAVTVTSTTISGGVCVMWTTSSATPTFQQLTWAANAWRFANSNGATPILGTCSNTASGGALPASCGTLTNSNTLAPIAVRAWVN